MKKLNPNKLFVEMGDSVNAAGPIIGRKYTLTHSDLTADLFLTISMEYAYDKITAMRDEVMAEWRVENGGLFLSVYVHVDGPVGAQTMAVRDAIFRRELPLALEAIVYGDREFFMLHPELTQGAIWVHFDSSDPGYNRFEYWGTVSNYQ
ncbi:staygreen family protein [Jeotgalibacillus proteolyticus]|uniref:Staygreen protein domain-containing protein n=1 Tax=Jeotgalibacillus proteolyticus TaxID=2082395 RepID=A0A2S5G7N4_9BACL|nr:staygreen family protein [Jeotgalibacillus proteolyticus]PPA68944.1 hypothetical protein C4B60_18715 [Jeotgalibacillus proteolyticus]